MREAALTGARADQIPQATRKQSGLSILRNYFYSQLRIYLSLYVRPTDRVVEILAHNGATSLSLESNRTLILACRSGSSADLGDIAKRVFEFQPDYVLLHGTVHYERDVQGLIQELRPGLPASCSS